MISSEWNVGFDEGYKWAMDNYNPNSGMNMANYPNRFVHRGDAWSCGFGEGLISGRSQKMRDVFGYFKSIHWKNGKAIIER